MKNRKTINISCLLKDNKIICFHISLNERKVPSDYYKDFYYSNTSMKNCDELYKVEYINVEVDEDNVSCDFWNFIYNGFARQFYKQWEIHPEYRGSPAY